MSNPLIAAITPKWAKNISTAFGDIAEKLAAAAAKRFCLLKTTPQEGNWAFQVGITLARSANIFAAWRYELYVCLGFWAVRVGFVPYKPILLKDKFIGTKQSIDGATGLVAGGTEPVEMDIVDEYHPDEANERP